ncbi:hypothetical protein [Actinocrispum wychmicini]|uniref:Uncharacterized protein n=1 Tax=Actinocrispum wychmicini TaxID=1213861 RepID=A0A4R2JSP3_9PSEU|nr:hypothetical protein [Actinocrispum wychmicini]TCO62127.1 hypothetical protein EV192_102264 [Actinocrispum wychmicini]
MTAHAISADAVAADYVHADKLITPGPQLDLPAGRLKWYDIARPAQGVDPTVAEQAREFLCSAELDGAGPLGFVVLHRCGPSFHFLILNTWRNENELWETVFAADGGPFEIVPQRPHHATYCVWELGAVCHEQQAWLRYLRSARDEPARVAYLADSFAGLV